MCDVKTVRTDNQPDMELLIKIPVPGSAGAEAQCSGMESLSMITSLVAPSDADPDHEQMILGVVDIMGSAVAEATGWRPPEQMDRLQ